MNKSTQFLLLLVGFALLGCSQVQLGEPLATKTSKELREVLEGTWMADDSAVHLAFDADGKGELAWVERDDDEFKMGKGELAAVVRDERQFLSIRIEEDGKLTDYFLFGEYVIQDETRMVVWPAEPGQFKQAIANGELAGEVDESKHGMTIKLSSKPAALLDFLEQNPDALDTRAPAIFQRLK